MTVWRLQTRTQGSLTDYCYKNKVAAMGWSFCKEEKITEEMRKSIQTIEDYCNTVKRYGVYKNYSCVERFAKEIKSNDIIWMRDTKGIYYIGRVGEESKWTFNNDAYDIDACNQRTDINWIKLTEKGDESCIPGAVTTAFIKGRTLQKIKNENIATYSAILYNELSGKNYYSNTSVELTESNFYSLLSPSDCEDLLYSWLYKQFGYICVPSTNKLSTPNYECVLLDPQTADKRIYIQVKNGEDNDYTKIDADDYAELNGEVWFLKTHGKVTHIEKYTDRMFTANSKELFEFACSEESNNILSPSIKTWVKFMKDHK